MYSEYQDLLQQYEWLECECIIRICVKLDIVRYMNIEVYEYNNACDNGISMGAATIPCDLFASPGKEYFLVSPSTTFYHQRCIFCRLKKKQDPV